jgi:hypothetical protein
VDEIHLKEKKVLKKQISPLLKDVFNNRGILYSEQDEERIEGGIYNERSGGNFVSEEYPGS